MWRAEFLRVEKEEPVKEAEKEQSEENQESKKW